MAANVEKIFDAVFNLAGRDPIEFSLNKIFKSRERLSLSKPTVSNLF